MLDLFLAIVHHILIFGIFGILFAELMAVRPDMSGATALRIASIDLWLTFAGIGLLSVPPTLVFIRWRKAGGAPDDAGIARVRRYVHVELTCFVLLLIFAAAMARGHGEF